MGAAGFEPGDLACVKRRDWEGPKPHHPCGGSHVWLRGIRFAHP